MPQLPGSQGTTRHFRQVAAMQRETGALSGTAGQLLLTLLSYYPQFPLVCQKPCTRVGTWLCGYSYGMNVISSREVMMQNFLPGLA